MACNLANGNSCKEKQPKTFENMRQKTLERSEQRALVTDLFRHNTANNVKGSFCKDYNTYMINLSFISGIMYVSWHMVRRAVGRHTQ